MSKPDTIATFPPATWRDAMIANLTVQPVQSRLLGGSLIMLIGSTLVSAVNFGYNVVVARMLGPAGFGHAAAAVTLLMLVSAITLSFQLVCAKFVAKNQTAGTKAAVYRRLMRRSWLVGVLLGSALMLARNQVADYLNLPDGTLISLLALGVAFYIPLGVKRGGMQGVCAFSRLTMNFLLEVIVKFVGAVVLIQLGFGVRGAVGAIPASVVLAYFIPLTVKELEARPEEGLPASVGEGMQAIVFFVGQVVINNVDILQVKHYFGAAEAGLYAAIALVGRVIYLASWSVVSAMFPISASNEVPEENGSMLVIPLMSVFAITVAFVVGLALFPDLVLRTTFGSGFHASSAGMDSLLSLYAASTGFYSLSVVLMAYEMSRKIANTSWIQLAYSGAIVMGIALFHGTLREVVLVQLVLKVILLAGVSLPFFRARMTQEAV